MTVKVTLFGNMITTYFIKLKQPLVQYNLCPYNRKRGQRHTGKMCEGTEIHKEGMELYKNCQRPDLLCPSHKMLACSLTEERFTSSRCGGAAPY